MFVWPPGGDVVRFSDRDVRRVVAAVRADTGAALAVPPHLDVDGPEPGLWVAPRP